MNTPSESERLARVEYARILQAAYRALQRAFDDTTPQSIHHDPVTPTTPKGL